MPSVYGEERRTQTGLSYRAVWRVEDPAHPKGYRRHTKDFGPSKLIRDKFIVSKRDELMASEVGLSPTTKARPWPEVSAAYLQSATLRKSPLTVKNCDRYYINSFSDFIGVKSIQSITTEDVRAWSMKLSESGLGPVTVGNYLRGLRTAFNYARREGWVQKLPVFEMPHHNEEAGRVIPGTDIQNIMERLPAEKARAVVLLLHTGLRLGELFALQYEDIRLNTEGHREAHVRTLKRKRGESQRIRVVPMHPQVLKVLGASGSHGPVVTGMTRNSFQCAFHDAVKALGLARTRVHDLRHTWATRYMETTGDLFGLMRMGGWKDLDSVERYQHLTRGRSQAVMELDFGVSEKLLPPIRHPKNAFSDDDQ